jgi:glycosyltransferase involved in cell wall biosynthesis
MNVNTYENSLVEPADTEAIADAMATISGDPGLRASLAEKAIVQAHKFNWLKMACLTMQAYFVS